VRCKETEWRRRWADQMQSTGASQVDIPS
jgi:hypothetical protein